MIGNIQAIGIASKGILAGSTIGLSSHGYLIQIEEFEYIPPITPTPQPERQPNISPAGGGGISSTKKRVIVVTVMAYGKKLVTRHILNDDIRKISIGDIQVIEGDNGPIGVKIKNKVKVGQLK